MAFSSFSFMAGSFIVHFQQQPSDPGDNSAATRPGTCTSWTRFRHLASRKEGGRDTKGSIPSAPKANKWHRLTAAATETCRNYLGFTGSHGDKLLHVFPSGGRWIHPPVHCCGVGPHLLPRSDVPKPPGAHSGARGPRNLPAALGSLLRDVENREGLLQIATMQLEGLETDVQREKQSPPVAANASFQLQGISV